MPDPIIHASSWTGPLEKQPPSTEIRCAVGRPWIPTEEERAKWAQPAQPPSRAVRRWLKLVVLLVFSPLLLVGSWLFVHAATSDELWADHREWLILWGLSLIAMFAREIHAGVPADASPRSAFLAFVLSATLGFAVWYPYAVLTAHDGAVPSQPQRTYELYHSCGRNCGYYVHQRPDGSTIEGTWVGDAVPYGSTCTLAERLDGDRGFSWIRVLDRSPPPEHELIWPIRREDCFSDKPLASIRS